MALPSRREFARRLRRLDGPEFASFVAALWRARGRSVRTHDDRLVVTHPDGRETVLAVHLPGSGPAPTPDADVVVTTAIDSARDVAPDGARVVGPADLREAMLYAVERDRADDVCRRYLDRPLDGERAVDGRSRSLPGTLATATVVLSVVLVAAGVVLSLGAGTGGTAEEGSAPAATPVPTTATPSSPPTDGATLAPGLTPAGVADVDALATAHAAALEDTAYAWRLTYREHGREDRFRLVAGRTELVAVADERRYRSSVYAWGRPHSVAPTAEASVYADGTVRYVRPVVPERGASDGAADAPVYVESTYPSADDFARRAGRYVRWYLSANRTDVRPWTSDSDVSYLVTAEGTPYPGARNYTATAVVDERGFVRHLRVEYAVPDTEVAVIVTFRYTDLGEAAVTPPEWARETGDGTPETAVTPVS